MLWGVRRRKRKILGNGHSFLGLPSLCTLIGAGGGILFSLLGFPTLSGRVFQLRPAAICGEYSLVSAFALCARFPVFLYLVSFSAFAPYLISCTMFVRGFLLAYSIACYMGLYGFGGLLTGLQLNLFHGILLLPYLFLLAGWGTARRERSIDRHALCIGVVTLAVSFAAAIPEYCLTPWMISLLSGFFDF